jgi:hypothetical protein
VSHRPSDVPSSPFEGTPFGRLRRPKDTAQVQYKCFAISQANLIQMANQFRAVLLPDDTISDG